MQEQMMEREVQTISPEAFQTCLVEIKEDGFQQTHCMHPRTKCSHTPEHQRQNLIPASAMNNSMKKNNALLHTAFPQEKKKKR